MDSGTAENTEKPRRKRVKQARDWWAQKIKHAKTDEKAEETTKKRRWMNGATMSVGETDRRRREATISQDLAFKRAVLKARKDGLERVTLGVFVDDSPVPPSYKRYDSAHVTVATQSVAGECADMGKVG